MTITPDKRFRFSAVLGRALQQTDDRESPNFFNFLRTFVDVQSTFMTADELLHKFDVRTDHGRPLALGRSVTSVELISSFHICPGLILPRKRH